MQRIWLTVSLIGCNTVERGSLEDATIYAIGDSIFEWHLEDQQSAPEATGSVLDLNVYNAAISGAQMTDSSAMSIPNQYTAGDWDWVILDGGANDLNDICSCGDCSTVQNQIETTLTTFVEDRREEGIGVVIWGYYGLPEKAEFGFNRCTEALAELRIRQQRLADTDTQILWVDGSVEITGEDASYFDEDNVHPSIEGSLLIGNQIAQAIQTFQSN